jgi:hypothetical protein
MSYSRRRLLIWLALILAIGGVAISWWVARLDMTKIKVELSFSKSAPDDRYVTIQNDTVADFYYFMGGSRTPDVQYRIQDASGWTQPVSLNQFNEGGLAFEGALRPGERMKIAFPGHAHSNFPLKPTVPFQVGIELTERPSDFTQQIKARFGRLLPSSFARQRSFWIWSETMTP